MISKYPSLFNKKKDLDGKKLRVIIWGRNEYNGSVQCEAFTFDNLDDPNFYYKDSHIHYHQQYNPNGSFRHFKNMSHHYVFDWRGVCVSHQPKAFLGKRWNARPGLPYAEIILVD
jgi:hypothetical protein